MIKYINGILGGGKTVLAVSYIYSLVPNNQIKNPILKDPDYNGDYIKCYTNISGLNTEDFNGALEFLNFDIINACALVQATLLEESKHIESIDTALNKFWDDVAASVPYEEIETDFDIAPIGYLYNEILGFRFNHVLIVIDEAADYFDEQKKYLAKWFNYSRHLFQDMILIQNDLSQITTSFKNDKTIKHFIQAADASNRLHPSLFKYAYFETSRQSKASKPSIKNVWIPKWIFSKYDSGKVEAAVPKIYIYAFGMLCLIGMMIYMLGSLFGSPDAPSPATQAINSANNKKIEPALEPDESIDREIACFKCSAASCIYKNDIFTFEKFNFYKERFNMELVYKNKYSSFTDFCFESDKGFFDMYLPPPDNNKTKISKFF
ncbi:zonular occludens toxin domain-containing protein [Sulfurimonas sp.]|uniref:zonular occludens toxin domain-containing protein n=1 Tax=Sulfurimonas sp. TaxID=2022749 RepID=UPI001A004722|nr:zonular occludens toxin domain-containing protein [Sulfurimonas sp.]MBE0515162.1 hypothetical protein [Sulfurimonas sp.]